MSPTSQLASTLDIDAIRAEFPQLERRINGKRLVYLDNAATTLKPIAVVDRIRRYYANESANIHRGVHTLSQEATEQYEAVREKVRRLINAPASDEVIFTRGTTDAINLVAHTWGRANLGSGDRVVVTEMEHHSNIVPWQIVSEATGCEVVPIPIDDNGALDMAEAARLIDERTRMVSVVAVSNSLGTVNPIAELAALARGVGATVLIDAAQLVAHAPVDVQAIDCDFLCFSGHKLYGPTGIGVLWGKAALLDAMPPLQGGGDMIRSVTFEGTTYAPIPHKFEAGTPHIAGVIGLGTAIDYLVEIGIEQIAAHEAQLLARGTELLARLPAVKLIGTAPEKAAVLSFVVGDLHPHDIGTIADQEGVALRTGHHCTQPVMDRFGVPATTRASLAVYNDERDLEALIGALERAMEVLS